ncbi:unnamed protein product [Pleuronectes platessa]|uniref:Uncharacterized protein n=1 Tax=Pleuronectes platessa TaxID=8262 RepID=A0A9N7Y9B0_PLEPL|nr:unnamed protein product [Pleuronectes platessa]
MALERNAKHEASQANGMFRHMETELAGNISADAPVAAQPLYPRAFHCDKSIILNLPPVNKQRPKRAAACEPAATRQIPDKRLRERRPLDDACGVECFHRDTARDGLFQKLFGKRGKRKNQEDRTRTCPEFSVCPQLLAAESSLKKDNCSLMFLFNDFCSCENRQRPCTPAHQAPPVVPDESPAPLNTAVIHFPWGPGASIHRDPWAGWECGVSPSYRGAAGVARGVGLEPPVKHPEVLPGPHAGGGGTRGRALPGGGQKSCNGHDVTGLEEMMLKGLRSLAQTWRTSETREGRVLVRLLA